MGFIPKHGQCAASFPAAFIRTRQFEATRESRSLDRNGVRFSLIALARVDPKLDQMPHDPCRCCTARDGASWLSSPPLRQAGECGACGLCRRASR